VDPFFDLTQAEIISIYKLIGGQKELLRADDRIKGFNIGINHGADAGQTIPHCHVHLIPGRKGDADNPRGGVRHMIPGKGY
jgi:diadenosine tetraphosphate (Ap4A) HIT family hydrolase